MKRTSKFAMSAGVLSVMALMSGSAMSKDLVFGFLPNSMAFPYDVVLADGFKAKAAEKGVKVVLLDSKLSVEAQANELP